MHNLVEEIEKANARQISDLLKTVMKRYNELYPDWEISILSLLKSGDTNEQLDRTIRMLQELKRKV